MSKITRVSLLFVLVIGVLGAALLTALISHGVQAESPADSPAGGGFPAQVLAVGAEAGTLYLLDDPGRESPEAVAELEPGDRVLRTNGGILSMPEGTYIPVYTATGEFGWLLEGEQFAASISPVYTTSSEIESGTALLVLPDARTSCYTAPTFRESEAVALAAGDILRVAGSPHQAELGIWWSVLTPNGDICWIYDAPGHFEVIELDD